MSLTLQETYDEVFSRFKAAWDTAPNGPFEIAWPDVPLSPLLQKYITGELEETTPLQPWARVTIRPNIRDQKTLGGPGNRLFTRNGILFVEIFTPTGDGMVLSNQLCELVQDAFEGISSPYKVWYRQTRINVNGIEGLWSRNTVTVEWESEQIF
jgi:hypothetical protein